MTEIVRIDRHRLGPADAEEQDAQRTDRVEAGQRIQRKPAALLCRGISQLICHKPVRKLMERCNEKNNAGHGEKLHEQLRNREAASPCKTSKSFYQHKWVFLPANQLNVPEIGFLYFSQNSKEDSFPVSNRSSILECIII